MFFFSRLSAPACLRRRGRARNIHEWHPERSTSGPVLIIVSLDDQVAYVYRNGIEIGRTAVSTGKPGHRTPTGIFTILNKDKDHHSSTYNNAPMPYSERLTWSGVALHAGILPGYPSSHGCVHLPLEFSKQVWTATEKGSVVVIAQVGRAKAESDVPLEKLLNLEKGPAAAAAADPGETFWKPELSKEGAVALVVSSADKQIEVFRNGVLIGKAPVVFSDPAAKLPHAIYLRLAPVKGKELPHWVTVDVAKEDSAVSVDHLVKNGVKLPSSFEKEVKKFVAPGTFLVTTPLSQSGRAEGGMVLVQANDAADPKNPGRPAAGFQTQQTK